MSASLLSHIAFVNHGLRRWETFNDETKESLHLFLLPDLDEHFIDLDLPVLLQVVELVIRHLVKVGLSDGIQVLQNMREGRTLAGIDFPTSLREKMNRIALRCEIIVVNLRFSLRKSAV